MHNREQTESDAWAMGATGGPPHYGQGGGGGRYGLQVGTTASAATERFDVDPERLRRLPLFKALHAAVDGALRADAGGNGELSYVIWGGLAANVALMMLGATQTFYSFHDIELILVRDGRITDERKLYHAVNEALIHADVPLPPVGGLATVKAVVGQSVAAWQQHRVQRLDGDLDWNNLAMCVNRVDDAVYLEGPMGTVSRAWSGERVLRVKSTDDVIGEANIARRIVRNTSKAIRFERCAGLLCDAEGMERMARLVERYMGQVAATGVVRTRAVEGGRGRDGESPTETSAGAGREALFRRALAETTKRLAGVAGVSRAEFGDWVIGQGAEGALCDHPMLRLLCSDEDAIGADVLQACYEEWIAYQPQDAEALRERYSLSFSA